ncbi:MAG: tetratricopeptide repeat protein [Terracidiphilus sp.]|jgi:Tfp pilus assembly protein PilF
MIFPLSRNTIGTIGFAYLIFCALTIKSPLLCAQAAPADSELAADLQRAHAALKANDQALATREFRAALRLDPGNAEAHANLGAIAFFRSDCSAAEPELHSALAAAPTVTNAQALLAVCERRLGQPSAEADLENAFANLKDAKLRVQVGVELADLYFQQGDLDRTLPVVHSLVESDPDNVDLLFFAQRIYSELADNTMNKLALLAPDSARMQQLIAERLINAGDLKSAIEHYRKAIALDSRLPGMHFELAESILESSNDARAQADARQELEAAIKIDGDSAKVECLLGRIALLQTGNDAAYEHYRRAYELNPNEVEAQLGLATILAEQDKPQEALPYLRSAVQADPMNANAHYRLARVCHVLHLADEEQKEIKLYREIRAAKDHVTELYRQMNRRAEAQDEGLTDEKQ